MVLLAFARRYLDAVNADALVDRIDEFYLPGAELVEGHWHGVGAPVRGRVAIAALMEARRALMRTDDLEIEGPYLAGNSDGEFAAFSLVARFVLRSVHGRTLQRVGSLSTFEMREGRIGRQVIYLSPALTPVEPASRWAAGMAGAPSA